jgi:DNA-binding LacI/PurR family transcriptional regulator
MSSIAEISREAGLARSTVADILRDRPGYNLDTCDRVKRIAREMGYRPSWLSKALRGGKSMTIGLLGCLLEDISAMSKAKSIESAALAEGYQVYFVNTNQETLADSSFHVQHLRDLLDRKIDGLIIDYVGVAPPQEVLSMVEEQTIPSVYMDWAPPGRANCVAVNRMSGIQEAVNHLSALQHQRVAIITTEWAVRSPNAKMVTYRQCLEAAGIEVLMGSDWTHRQNAQGIEFDTCRVVRRQLARGGRLPTAMILFDDLAAVGAMRGVFDAGLRVPEDISVLGFNDLGIAQVSRPALTTVHQPRAEVGQAACEMLFNLMQGKAESIESIEFGCKLVARESTGPAAVRHGIG